MPRTELPIANGFYVSRSKPLSNQICINAYPQTVEGGGLSQKALFGTAGINGLTNTGEVQQINRGSHVKNGIPYFVNGETLYRIDRTVTASGDTFSFTALGTIPGSNRVSMADNGTQLMVLVPGGNGYIYNEDDATPFQQITDPDFTANGNPQYCEYIDGYFVVTTDSKKFITSALNDGLSWNALDFGSAEADPDDIVAPVVYRNQLFITGSETIEVFQNIGGAGFPFQRVEGFILPVGCYAPNSLIKAGKTFVWIGGGTNESPSIYAFNGNQEDRISTDAIDEILRTYSDDEIQQSFAVYYSQSKADFAAFTINDRTFVYNFVDGLWHERQSRVTFMNEVSDTRWRVNSLVTAYNRVLVGDGQDGRIGELDLDIYEEYGQNILRTVATVPFANQGRSFTVPALELTMEAGVGDAGTPDPKIRVSRSKDGKVFKDERTRSVGKIGEFERRTIWRRMGRANRFEVFKFEFSEKVKFAILKLEADIEGMTK